MRRTGIWVALLAAAVCLGAVAAVAEARRSKPRISSFKAIPASVPSGSRTTVEAEVSSATSCTLSSTPGVAGLPITSSCQSLAYKQSFAMPADTGARPVTYKLSLVASGPGGQAKAKAKIAVTDANFTIELLQRVEAGSYTTDEIDASVGQAIQYEAVVRNLGTATLHFAALNESGCEGVTPGGGTQLAAQASETFACEHVPVFGGAVTNEASIEAERGGVALSNRVSAKVAPGQASQVSAGGRHTCALVWGGHIACWGNGEAGELGDRATIEQDDPVEVFAMSGASEVASGWYYACALAAGKVYCWGFNGEGQLGDLGSTGPETCGTYPCSRTPVEVLGIGHATQLSAAVGDACALLASGHVECWGDNTYGQLGDESPGGPQTCGEFPCSRSPVEVLGISSATQISAGGDHTCALLASGHIYCWGANGSGQLGNGTFSTHPPGDSLVPVEVRGISNAVQVSSDLGHSCAVLASGHVDCWGNNRNGDLGNGTTNVSDTPVEVSGIGDAIQVAAGSGPTCAVLASGHVECWGSNEAGGLGDGSTEGPEVCGIVGFSEFACSRSPVEVQGITTAAQITAGFELGSACALLSGGQVECWGANGSGQLGDGTSLDTPPFGAAVPTEVQGL